MFKEKNEQKKPIVLWKLIALALLYYISARVGLMLATFDSTVSPFWPATGISFGILYLFGSNYWPSITLGAFFANSLTGISLPSVLLISLGNTLHGVIGNQVLHYFKNNLQHFGMHPRTLGIILASSVGAFISASVGTLALILFQHSPWENFQNIWFTWFTGDLLGAIIYFPLLLAFFREAITHDVPEKKKHKLLSYAALIIIGLFLLWLIFIHEEGSIYLFFLFPYLFWVIDSAGERGITLATVLFSIVGAYSIKFGFGVFKHGSVNSNLLNLELFSLSVGISSLMMIDLKKQSPLKRPGQILFASWLLAGLFFFGFYIRSIKESDKHFDQIISSAQPLIESKLNLYFTTLQSGTGLFAASDSVERNEWKDFLENGQFEKKLIGIEGLGVIFKVKKNSLESFLRKTRADHMPDFTYHLYPQLTEEQKQKAKKNEDLYIVTFFEPREINKERIGIDISSEEKRKLSADLARDLGTPSLSETVTLFNDPTHSPAFILFFPFYSKGSPPQNIEERRKRIQGWIYTPLRTSAFFQSIFSGDNFKEISYSISDQNGQLVSEAADFKSLPDTHLQTHTMRLGNRNLNFKFKRSRLFYSSQDAFSSWAGAISAIISLIIGAFIVSLQNVKENALLLAEQKTADLKASEELWKYALQGAGDCVWDWDIPNEYVNVSGRIEQIIGFSPVEVQGNQKIWLGLIHPDDFHRIWNQVQEDAKNNLQFYNEYRMRCKSGEYKWVLARGMVIKRDSDNNPVRMIGTLSDISKFKEAEHEIERQRARLQAIYDSSSDALLLFSIDRNIDCNSRALKLFGYETKEEFLKYHPGELSPPLQPDGMKSMTKANLMLQQAFAKGMVQFEWLHKKKSGEVFPAEVTLTAFDYDGQKCIHGAVRDITERKLAEASLISQREKLVAAAKMSSLGEMAGGIAHEINNPLAIIAGKVAQLKRKIESGASDTLKSELENLNVIETTAKRIASIIKGLNAFSRNAENDQMELVEIKPLLLDTLELSKERFRFNSINLKVNLLCSDKTTIMGRPSQILQVLINLLNNAYDAVELLDERWVEVTVKSEESQCKIIVTDSGPGIPSHLLEKIMTPFFTTKRVGKGTGLGLSISKGIIEDHKGKLYYDLKNPHTSFIIELPLA